jgi:hypothetical protein
MEFYSENVTNVVCGVGDKVKLCRSVGYPPVTWEDKADKKIYLNGFRVVYPKLGEFDGFPSAINEKSNCVYYKHLKSGRQVIEFVSDFLGKHYFYLILEGIVVHDHASIPQGGPAYATYYSEPEEGSGEES